MMYVKKLSVTSTLTSSHYIKYRYDFTVINVCVLQLHSHMLRRCNPYVHRRVTKAYKNLTLWQ